MRYIVMKLKVFTFFVALLISFVSVFLMPAQPSLAEGNPGAISVCKIVVDENSNVVTGADKPGAVFTISGFTPNPVTSQGAPAGVLPLTTFTTPLTYNTDILGGIPGNDAYCVTYTDLPLGSYYWTEESTPADGWDAPFYSDQYTGPVTNIMSLYSYTNQLFDGDLFNDAARNMDADGNIILNNDRPTRMLVVVNRYKSTNTNPPFVPTATPGATLTPTPTTQPSNPGGPGDGLSDGRSDGRSSCPECTQAPQGQVLSTATGQVLGASTMAGTGEFDKNVMNLYLIFGMLLLLAGYTSYAKEKKLI